MKKLIIIALITGSLTVQVPIQALRMVDYNALAQANAAQEIANSMVDKEKRIAALKSICTKTNRLRNTLIAGGVLSAGAIAAYAYTYGLPVDCLMPWINTPVAAAAGAFDACNEGMINLGTGCVETCTSGFSDIAGQCVEAICPAATDAAQSAAQLAAELAAYEAAKLAAQEAAQLAAQEAARKAAELAAQEAAKLAAQKTAELAAQKAAELAAYEAARKAATDCLPQVCKSEYVDLAGQCVNSVLNKLPAPVDCTEGFVNVGNTCVKSVVQAAQNSTVWNSICSGTARFFGMK